MTAEDQERAKQEAKNNAQANKKGQTIVVTVDPESIGEHTPPLPKNTFAAGKRSESMSFLNPDYNEKTQIYPKKSIFAAKRGTGSQLQTFDKPARLVLNQSMLDEHMHKKARNLSHTGKDPIYIPGGTFSTEEGLAE